MGTNPFAAVAEFWSPLAMKVYIVLMILAVIIGTLFDVWHKGSGIYFAQRREKSKALARNPLGSGEAISLALATIAEAAVFALSNADTPSVTAFMLAELSTNRKTSRPPPDPNNVCQCRIIGLAQAKMSVNRNSVRRNAISASMNFICRRC